MLVSVFSVVCACYVDLFCFAFVVNTYCRGVGFFPRRFSPFSCCVTSAFCLRAAAFCAFACLVVAAAAVTVFWLRCVALIRLLPV